MNVRSLKEIARSVLRWLSDPRALGAELLGLARGLPAAHPLLPLPFDCSPASLLHRNARRYPRRPALRFVAPSEDAALPLPEPVQWTWSELEELTRQTAARLRAAGLEPGETLALLAPNVPETLVAQMAAHWLGAAVALLHPELRGAALRHAIAASHARLLLIPSSARISGEALRVLREAGTPSFTFTPSPNYLRPTRRHDDAEGSAPPPLVPLPPAQQPVLQPPNERKPDELVSLVFTSGTTGLPKPARISGQRWWLATTLYGHIMHQATSRDTVHCALPLAHAAAQWGGWGVALQTGACLLLAPRFSARRFWHEVHAGGATRITYIGELWRYLLARPPSPEERTHRVRRAVGNGLRPELWHRVQRRFAIPRICEFYGATEGNAPLVNLAGRPGYIGRLLPIHLIVRCDPDDGRLERDARGRCIPVRPGERGALLVRIAGPFRYDGYLDPDATSRKIVRDVLEPGDAWFHSGDVVELHPRGWVRFADRVGDTYRWKGENVSTEQVATVLAAASGVREALVVGVAVPGAEGRAGLAVLRIDPADFALPALARHVQRELPRYAWPRFLRLTERPLPTTTTLKYRKRDYRERGHDPRTLQPGERLLVLQPSGGYAPFDEAAWEAMQRGALQVP